MAASLACGGGQKVKDPLLGTRGDGDGDNGAHGHTGAPTPELAVRGKGVGDDRDSAYAAAVADLARALLTEEGARYAVHAGIPVHDRLRDYSDTSQAGQRVTVAVGLSSARANEILTAMESHSWDVRGPGFISEILAPAMAARVAAITCGRRARIATVAPSPPDGPEPAAPQEPGCPDPRPGTDSAAEVANLVASVRLRSYYNDGVPLTEDGRPLRALVLLAERRARGQWLPFAQLPVAVREPAAAALFTQARVKSGDRGQVTLTFVQGVTWPADGIRVAIDREHLLGPFADLWPADRAEVVIQGRHIGMQRWTLITDERVDGTAAKENSFAAGLDQAVSEGGGQHMVRIKSAVARELLAASPADLATRLPELADAWDGDIDILVISRAESQFAGRMSANRVWFEAQAMIEVYSAWTGQKLASFEDKLTASGIGNERADREARTELSAKLARKLLATY